ncbi:hypothetical protein J2T17_004339 [Paenibacillus mucilaginosus]|uniref:hypothetical protein n=1 Tax=Paenibacillus mucilaginosus TaxID=61624 RepID=UPI003D1B7D29
MKKIILLLFLLHSTLLISCGEPKPIPNAQVTTGNSTSLTPYQMGSNWEGNLEYSTRLALKDKEADVVPPNSKITISYDTPPKENTLELILWPGQYTGTAFERIKLEDSSFTVPAEKGTYIYSFNATWASGDVTYWLKIEVE